jgi:transcriptional regulator with XRE-family HTH domain
MASKRIPKKSALVFPRASRAQQARERVLMRQWGNGFRAARRNVHLTQVELAKRAKVAPLSVSAWEMGSALPTLAEWRRLYKIAPDTPKLPGPKTPLPELPRRPRAKARLVIRDTPAAFGPYADFANRLRLARNTSGLTRDQLAKAAKVSPGSIANWETGGHLPQHAPLARLRAVLAAEWGTPDRPSSLAAWEAGLPKVEGRVLRRRAGHAGLADLRERLSSVPGAYGFVSRLIAAIGAGRVAPAQIKALASVMRQFEKPAAASTSPKTDKPVKSAKRTRTRATKT